VISILFHIIYNCQFEAISVVQGAAEIIPRFGRGIASGGERVQWWGARRRTVVYVPFSVYTMAWLGEHRAFIVEEFIQCAFLIHFALGQWETVPDKKTIYRWVSNFRQTGSALKQTSPGRPRTATGLENVAVVRASIQKSPLCSARKHKENSAPRSANASLQNCDCTKTEGK